jgi:hypothetical protein
MGGRRRGGGTREGCSTTLTDKSGWFESLTGPTTTVVFSVQPPPSVSHIPASTALCVSNGETCASSGRPLDRRMYTHGVALERSASSVHAPTLIGSTLLTAPGHAPFYIPCLLSCMCKMCKMRVAWPQGPRPKDDQKQMRARCEAGAEGRGKQK